MADKKPGLLGRLFGSSPNPAPAPAPAPRPVPRQVSSSATKATWPKTATVFSLGIPSKIGDHKAKYRYDDVAAVFSSNAYMPGLPLELRAGGEIFAAGSQIGTYSGEKIRKMVRDFNSRGEPVQARLCRMNEDATGLVYAVFYKIPNYTKERLCKVSGTGSESRQGDLMAMSPGDELYLEEDVDHEGRVNVSDVGYLGAKDAEWALDELNFDFCEVTVNTVDLNDSGKYVLTVKIRY